MNKTTAAWLGAGTATLMLPAAAEAAGTKPEAYLSPGVVWSSASGPGRAASGFGFEISGGLLLTRKQEPTGDPNNMYPAPDTDDLVKLLLTTPSVGAVFRTEGYTSAEATFRRYTYALQGGFGPLGVELGWGHRTSYLTEPARGGFHLSPFVTIGWLYAGPQWLFDGGTPREFAFQVGLKLPLPYSIAIPLGLIGGSPRSAKRPAAERPPRGRPRWPTSRSKSAPARQPLGSLTLGPSTRRLPRFPRSLCSSKPSALPRVFFGLSTEQLSTRSVVRTSVSPLQVGLQTSP
jgi:hypothetical protein